MYFVICWDPVIIPPVHDGFDKILYYCTKQQNKNLHPPSVCCLPPTLQCVRILGKQNQEHINVFLYLQGCFKGIFKFKSQQKNSLYCFVSNNLTLAGSVAYPAAPCPSSFGHHRSAAARCSNRCDSAKLSAKHSSLSPTNTQYTVYIDILWLNIQLYTEV